MSQKTDASHSRSPGVGLWGTESGEDESVGSWGRGWLWFLEQVPHTDRSQNDGTGT